MEIARCLWLGDAIKAAVGPELSFDRLTLHRLPGHLERAKALAAELGVVAVNAVEVQQPHRCAKEQSGVRVVGSPLTQSGHGMAQALHGSGDRVAVEPVAGLICISSSSPLCKVAPQSMLSRRISTVLG